jgi:hypothetical protein
MKQIVSVRGRHVEERLGHIEAQHKAFDARLRELGRRPHLTPSEQREVIELKKKKLKAKDVMSDLRRTS